MPARHPRRGTALQTFLKGVVATFAVLVLLSSATGYAVLTHLRNNIATEDPFGAQDSSSGRPPPSGRAVNYLLLGTDTRTDCSRAAARHFGDCHTYSGANSDTAILIHLSPRRDKVLLVSFPRDSQVEIPGHGRHKLNWAYPNGGTALARSTIEQLTQVRIDHTIVVNFDGFKSMVAALGGVDVCVPRAIHDQKSGLDIPAGPSHLDTDMALSFVRARYAVAGGDIGRIAHQQQLIGAMFRKASASLLQPGRLLSFLDRLTGSITVDKTTPTHKGLSFGEMKSLGLRLRRLDPAHVTFVTVAYTSDRGGPHHDDILLDDEANRALFDAINADSAIPGAKPRPTTSAPALTVHPDRVHVRVLNGTPTKGLAKRAGAALAAEGFDVVDVATADSDGYSASVVRYGPDRAESAQTLAAAIPGAGLQLDQSLGGTLELVLGSSYTDVVPVTISTPTSTPTASTSQPPIKETTAADDPCAGF